MADRSLDFSSRACSRLLSNFGFSVLNGLILNSEMSLAARDRKDRKTEIWGIFETAGDLSSGLSPFFLHAMIFAFLALVRGKSFFSLA
jgi:hypothetical protein